MKFLITQPWIYFKYMSLTISTHLPTNFNIFIHAPMEKPSKLLQLYRFIKFPLTQTIGCNMDQDLLAVSKDYQYKLMDQADFLSCKQYRTTFLCKDRDVTGKDLVTDYLLWGKLPTKPSINSRTMQI